MTLEQRQRSSVAVVYSPLPWGPAPSGLRGVGGVTDATRLQPPKSTLEKGQEVKEGSDPETGCSENQSVQ